MKISTKVLLVGIIGIVSILFQMGYRIVPSIEITKENSPHGTTITGLRIEIPEPVPMENEDNSKQLELDHAR